MPYRVELSRTATRDISRVFAWYGDHNENLGQRWHDGVLQRINSLATNPERCGLAHETNDFDFEIREHLYGVGRKKTHRILFQITEETVEVLAVRHVAQQDFSSDDI